MNTCPACGASYPPTVRLCPVDGEVLESQVAADPALGTLLGGKYRLDAVAGRGGMGVVYRATHVMLGKTVAVKLISKELAPSSDFVLRFQREARAAGRLDHPNIAAVYDLGQCDDGTLYIAMEYVTGTSLRDVLQADGPLPPGRIAHIGRQVAAALSVAHRHDIIHRDLKPQNVAIGVDAEGREQAKLLDFGIAKSMADDATKLTSTGLAIGTPQYMSPEQAAGQALDGRSDIYSLGVMLYQMLIGIVPFDAPSTPAVLVKHLNETPQLPSARRPDLAVSPEIEAVAMRCLEKDPAARFQTADEVISALDAMRERGGADPTARLAVVPSAAALAPTLRMPNAGDARGLSSTVRSPSGPPAPTPHLPSRSSTAPAPVPAAAGASPQAPRTGTHVLRSRGSSLLLVLIVLAGMGGVGFAAYALGYWSGPRPEADSTEITPPVAAPDPPAAPAQDAPETSQSGAASLPPPAEPPAISSAGPPAVSAPPPQTSQAPPPQTAPPGPPAAADPRAADAAPPQAIPEPARPEHPSVRFGCDGPADACVVLQSTVDQELGRASMPSLADESKAELIVDALVVAGAPRSQEMFGTVMVIKSYTITVVASDRRTGVRLPMQEPVSFTFDDRVGQTRLTEQARLVAAATVQRLRAYWAAKD
jgi:serine/threonine-protein kinase